jgi:hypothetical protein
MDETENRNIKILGIGWLAVGGLAFTFALITYSPLPKATLHRQLKLQMGIGFSSRLAL